MTPEEQFILINNALQHAAEIQAQHAEAIRKHDEAIHKHDEEVGELRQMHKSLVVAVGRIAEAQLATHGKLDSLIATVGELRAAQKQTDGKMNALIDTVDRIIRRDNGHAG